MPNNEMKMSLLYLTFLITMMFLRRSLQHSLEPLAGGRQEPQLAFSDDLFRKRDECSDVFGSGARNSMCAPSGTLCCVRNGQQFPSCQQLENRGWCCVGNNGTDNCYVDLDPTASCSEPNAVTCENSSNDTRTTCCPQLTTCVSGYNGRCQIAYGALQAIAATARSTISSPTATLTSTSTRASSSVSASTSTSLPSSLTSTSASLPPSSTPTLSSSAAETTSPPPAISSSVLAGSVVGAVAGVFATGGIAFYFLRRRWIAKHGLSHERVNDTQTPPVQDLYLNSGYPEYKFHTVEISGQRLEPMELDASRRFQ
ncbi:hypothetical protein F4677DRAFT_410499 [Hypoxylon crocopeplum]|nr:hypothetical protein F4677DRAFT_410499 [Hypoxylon crocopeplum]